MLREFWVLWGESEVDLDFRLDFDRLALKNVRTIFPLPRGVQGGGSEKRIAGNNLELSNVALFTNERVQHHNALHMFLTGFFGVDGIHFLDEHARNNAGRNAHALMDRPKQDRGPVWSCDWPSDWLVCE
jgi:hypothetical protein